MRLLRFALLIALTVLNAMSLLAPAAQACGAQVQNRYFIEAGGVYRRLDAQTRSRLVEEWGALETEQRELWRMAGEVDAACARGEPYAEIQTYHSRVLEWEEKLRAFLDRMKNMTTVQVPVPASGPNAAPSPSPSPDPEAKGADGSGLASEITFEKPAAKAKPAAPKKPAPEASEPPGAAPLYLK